MSRPADRQNPSASKATYLAAALAVLRAERRPLTDRQITELALQRGLIRTSGKTPQATVTACLYTTARDHPEIGLVRLHEPGPTRARRGSVRWSLRQVRLRCIAWQARSCSSATDRCC